MARWSRTLHADYGPRATCNVLLTAEGLPVIPTIPCGRAASAARAAAPRLVPGANTVADGSATPGPTPDADPPHLPHLVLVVEDDLPLARLMDALLTSDGYRVASASDGQTALDLIRREPPALILLDLTLPHMDGWEVLARIRRMQRPSPVALLTGNAAAATRARDAGAATIILKPFDVEELLRTVAWLLADAPSA